jgi:hypothetical protein
MEPNEEIQDGDAQFDPSTLTSDESEELDNDEQPESEDGEEEEFEFLGRSYPKSKVEELLQKGEGFTAKTQDLSRQRTEQAATIAMGELVQAALNGDVQARAKLESQLQPQQHGQYSQDAQWDSFEGFDQDMAAPNEVALATKIRQLEQQFEQKLNKLVEALDPIYEGYVGSAEVQKVSETLGVQVTKAQIDKAKQLTGIQDGLSAVLLAQHKLGGIPNGQPPSKKPAKPVSPGSRRESEGRPMSALDAIRLADEAAARGEI